MTRAFTDSPALRSATPLLIGLVGPSGCGKTLSALRLAVGIQRVSKGRIYHIDTEANRALHYAPSAGEKPAATKFMYDFQHVPFAAPFGSLAYLEAIEYCRSKDAGIIIVDSGSHEHEGPGGVLETHDAEVDRLSKAWNTSRDKVNLAAWQKPKSDRRRLINSILQMPINFIFCFRAKEKVKPGKDGKMLDLGWQPIAGEEFIYEMTVNILLHPSSGGVPTWDPAEPAERQMVKLPSQFSGIFSERRPLCEDIGESLARWAAGGPSPSPAPAASFPARVSLDRNLARRQAKIQEFREKVGDAKWHAILGANGATCLAEITTIKQADAIGVELKQAMEESCPKA